MRTRKPVSRLLKRGRAQVLMCLLPAMHQRQTSMTCERKSRPGPQLPLLAAQKRIQRSGSRQRRVPLGSEATGMVRQLPAKRPEQLREQSHEQ